MATAELTAALDDLEGAYEEAAEEGYPQPSLQAIEIARRLVRDLYSLRPCRLEVYPTSDGEIAIEVPGGPGRAVLMLCDSNGQVLCLVSLNGRSRRAHYSSAATLPDGFVREAVSELDEPGSP